MVRDCLMKFATTSVPALERGLDVLELLNQVPDGLGISELAARLSLNKNVIDRIRSRRFSTDYAEAYDGIHCVAAPVVDSDENMIAVVWVSAPSKRMPKSMFVSMGKQVLQCADAIAGRLGR